MLFGTKKRKRKHARMIDVGRLQQKGRVHAPVSREREIETDSDGFAVVGSSSSSPLPLRAAQSSSQTPSFSREHEGYSKREVDAKVEELDRTIYKLEQRIEVLERKAGVDPGTPSSSSSKALIGW